jgi:tetratricopeptide (TPR) repeat protein
MNSKEKALLYRGMDKVRQKKYEPALEIFDRIIAENPNITEVWNNRGVALYGLGRLDEALQSYEQSLTLDGENMDALRNKAFLLRSQRKLVEALAAYDTVLQKGGDGCDLESAAVVLTGLGRLEEALSCLYLAREQMSLKRLEDEIAAVKALMEQRGIPVPGRRAPQGKV